MDDRRCIFCVSPVLFISLVSLQEVLHLTTLHTARKEDIMKAILTKRHEWNWKVWVLALLALLPVTVLGGTGASTVNANSYLSVPGAQAVTRHSAQPLENGPAVKPAPPYKTAPSDQVTNDPHWRSPNVRANTDTTTYAQQEPAIAINPNNHLNIVAAQKDERRAPSAGSDTKEVWIDTSTDGGLTWPVQTNIPMPDTTQWHQSDPVVTFSDDNTVFVTIIGYGPVNQTSNNHTMVARSLDGGLTWQNAVFLNPTQGGSDKEWTAIDLNPSSPYYHRVYVTWTNFAAGPQFIEKWSSDNGVTWNPPGGSNYATVSYGSYDGGQFSMPVVLPNGNVIATWDPGGLIAVGKSTDGGQSFINPNITAVSITEVNDVPGSNWRLNTIPSTAASRATGTLVTVWADGRNGKDDIYYTRSTNGGATWSAATRVAHNAAGSSYQVEPWVSVAPNGRFDVIWYDSRDSPGNPNVLNIYATHSTDDGASWTGPDEQVTDASTDLNIGIPTGGGWNAAAGDYIGVASVDDAAYAVWTDTRSGNNEDAYTSRYTPGQGGSTPTPVPPTNTPTATPPGATPTPCDITFSDVNPSDYFYEAVRYLFCAGAITGYGDNTFRPYNNTTRAQLSKIIVLAEGWPIDTTGGPHFTDVPTGHIFYDYVETAYNRAIISGYGDGTFRPDNNVTRAQLSKIIVLAQGWPIDTSGGPHFTDVPESHPFYNYVETAFNHAIITGYGDGTFRPTNSATRGQISKIVYSAITNP